MKVLVSVRNRHEAAIALACGADIIDLKEPANGSLGAASIPVRTDIADFFSQHPVATSVALGELNCIDSDSAFDELVGFDFAKIGLSWMKGRSDWLPRWRCWAARLSKTTTPVAVAYADAAGSGSPDVWQVLHRAIELNFEVLLIDTFDKHRGTVFEHIETVALRDLMSRARAAGMLTVLAGSISCENFSLALDVAPNVIAIRGAACAGDRTGGITADCLQAFLNHCGHKVY